MKMVLINVGLSGIGRGIIFPDRSFVFIPIHAKGWTCKRLPRYKDLPMTDYTFSRNASHPDYEEASLADIVPRLAKLRAHDDPDFKHLTYGHAKRGFGYEPLLGSLLRDDILLLYATLDYRHILGVKRDRSVNPNWGAYIVGAFLIDDVYTDREFTHLPSRRQERFRDNQHYYCHQGAHMWIAGQENEFGLFRKGVPLSSSTSSLRCLPLLRKHFATSGGKRAGSAGWYRAAFVCDNNAKRVWNTIAKGGQVPTPVG